MIPHSRTLRRAREQVKAMVKDGFSTQRIRRYLHRYVLWWVKTSMTWSYQELLESFIQTCWDSPTATIAYGLLRYPTSSTRELAQDCLGVA